MTTITVVAAIADKDQITLYKIDGGMEILSVDDYRTEEIMNEVLPKIAQHQQAEVDVSAYAVTEAFEASVEGVIVFFKVGRETVKGILHPDVNSNVNVQDIIDMGDKPTSMTVSDEETIVAVVDDKIIPDMEKLEKQFHHSNQTNPKGMTAFLKRVSKVIDKRRHSVEDLMTFMEKADLPIADDGCVIAYKVLASTAKKNVFVDKHTKKVTQRIGSKVFMKESMVDPDNRVDCSNGLHIARRGYVGGFRSTSDPVVICKIAPEDFIAVPQYDANKVRVSGYHIIEKLPVEAATLLANNKPMTDLPEMEKLLGSIIAGDHSKPIETVEITGSRGEGLIITPTGKKISKPNKVSKSVKAIDVDGVTSAKSPITPKNIRKKADAIIKTSEEQKLAFKLLDEGKLSKAEIARKCNTSTRTLGRWIEKRVEPKEKEAFDGYVGATPEQKKAIDAFVTDGKSKAEAARIGNTSLRTFGRWLAKFGL